MLDLKACKIEHPLFLIILMFQIVPKVILNFNVGDINLLRFIDNLTNVIKLFGILISLTLQKNRFDGLLSV